MANVRYPQLHDPDFLARTMDVPAAELAAQLGCRPHTVERYRQDHRLLQRTLWSDVELDLLARFYGLCPVACLCQALADKGGLAGVSAIL